MAGTDHLPPLATGRSAFVDLLRGAALVGICLVNLPFMALPLLGDAAPRLGVADAVGAAVGAATLHLKFFPIFSLLFGYGFAELLRRIAAGAMTPMAYLRRLLGLFALGAAHAVILFPGDILMVYAGFGAVLWWLRSCPDHRLNAIAAGAIALSMVTGALVALAAPVQPTAGWTPALDAVRAAHLGSWDALLGQRLVDLPIAAGAILLLQGPIILAMFCLGLRWGRHGLLDGPDPILDTVRRHRRWLIPVAVIGNGVFAIADWLPQEPRVVVYAVAPVAGLALAALIVAGLAWLARAGWWALVQDALRQAGRMSLSNYLAQSLVANALMMGWGFGLYGRFDRLDLLAIGLASAVAVIAASWLWSRRFRIGPCEWLLRAWSDLRRPGHRP
jgi:uncharacterized protein